MTTFLWLALPLMIGFGAAILSSFSAHKRLEVAFARRRRNLAVRN